VVKMPPDGFEKKGRSPTVKKIWEFMKLKSSSPGHKFGLGSSCATGIGLIWTQWRRKSMKSKK